mmetsp:Transcript_38302/g.81780  ORF Transcript_38302/g.81780 Transcript_38302/m.81780 type:complete len:145 (+) Transcript_38302:46-480(+)
MKVVLLTTLLLTSAASGAPIAGSRALPIHAPFLAEDPVEQACEAEDEAVYEACKDEDDPLTVKTVKTLQDCADKCTASISEELKFPDECPEVKDAACCFGQCVSTAGACGSAYDKLHFCVLAAEGCTNLECVEPTFGLKGSATG